ncbi:MAG: 50S ribosomal protein L7 [Oscillospiraceae bacterium]|nr:50S ribosomal protein L7 [Oscillospiraceae bacterium]
MEHDRALGLLCLAKKGGNLQLGEEGAGAACRAGHARLLLLASDAAGNTQRRAGSFSQGGKIPIRSLPYDKETLGGAFGRAVCAIAALTDVSMALAFVKALGQPEQDRQLLEELERRTERVRQRRKEEQAHRKNLRHGKK